MFFGENPVSDLSLHVLWAPALYIMGGQLWFLGHVCSSYMCTGSSSRCYGVRASQGQEPSNKLTTRTLLIPHINVLGLTTRLFFTANTSKPPKHAYDVYLQHLYTNVCLGPRASNSLPVVPYRFLPTQVIELGRHRLPRRTDQHCRPAFSLCPPPHPSVVPTSSHPSLWRICPLSPKD